MNQPDSSPDGTNPYAAEAEGLDSPPPHLASQHQSNRHPIGFWFFFWGEFAERCSYYGMRAILLLYMTSALEIPDQWASVAMSLFMAACYFLPLAGGWVADNYFGKYWTIVGFSIPYILGHVILGIENIPCLVIALSLLAMGSGVIKPNISTLMGLTYDQQRPGQDRLRGDAFAMFYFSINIGAFLSTWAVPLLRNEYGYFIAFLFPAALMVLAFGVFAAGKRFYAKETIVRTVPTLEEREQRLRVFLRILALFAVVAFFWMVFDQSVTTLTLFARDHLDRTIRVGAWSYEFTADQLQMFNPLLILILLPIITLGYRLFPGLRPTDKMQVGFVLTGVTTALMAVAGYLAREGPVSIYWEVVAYVIVTTAEILISVTGLELAFTAAPKSMKGFVTACWLAGVGVANIVNAFITPLYSFTTPDVYFAGLTLAAIPVCLAFYAVAKTFNRPVESLGGVDTRALREGG